MRTDARLFSAFSILTIALALAMSGGGCASSSGAEQPGGQDSAQSGEQQQRQYSRRGGPLAVRDEVRDIRLLRDARVRIVGLRGAVVVTGSDLESGVVRARLAGASEDRAASASLRTALSDDGVFDIRIDWPGGEAQPREVSSFEISLPRNLQAIEIENQRGAVSISGLRGEARIRSSAGAVTVSEHHGDVDVETTGGRLSFDRVRGAMRGRTTGNIAIVRASHGAIDIETKGAGIDVDLPGQAQGPMRLVSDIGAISMRVGPGFAGTIRMESELGPVRVENPRAVATVVRQTQTEAVVRFENGGPESLAKTQATIELRVFEQ